MRLARDENGETGTPRESCEDVSGFLTEGDALVLRGLKGWQGTAVTVVAIFMSLFHIYVFAYRLLDPWYLRAAHLALGGVLVFAYYPGSKGTRDRLGVFDYLFFLSALAPFVYVVVTFDGLIYRAGVDPTHWDTVVAIIAIVSVLEMARRTQGIALPVLAALFMLYGRYGAHLSGPLFHRGYSWSRMTTYIFSLEGILGTPIMVSATYVVIFVVFGAFLQASGCAQFFVDLAYAMAGRLRGGPAKVAVLASALFGTISGTSAGNVVTTGCFTIPLMKKTGYSPEFAGATEAASSTGGQIMPPIMGAGAFIMAEILAIPYHKIIQAAAIPALMYFVAIYFMVDIEAQKTGLTGMPSKKNLKKVLRDAYLFLPVAVVFYCLVFAKVSIMRAGLLGIISCILVSQVKHETRMGLGAVLQALAQGARNCTGIVATCAAAGVLLGVVTQTGLGLKFAGAMAELSGDNLFLSLVLAMVASIVLGMGLPTTAAYAISASVIAPGLIQMGLHPLQAHLFVFYFACVSAITPPVALAAYAGAAIARAKPIEVGLKAFRMGSVAFIVPYMFAYGPSLLMLEPVGNTLLAALTALVGVYSLSVALGGWFKGYLTSVERMAFFVSALLLMRPGQVTDIIGLALFVIILLLKKHGLQGRSVSKITGA